MAPVENIHQAQMQRDDVLGNFAAVASNHAMDVKGVLAPAPRTTLRRRRVNVNNLAWEWEVEMRDWAPLYLFLRTDIDTAMAAWVRAGEYQMLNSRNG